jgi:hypothetical protein
MGEYLPGWHIDEGHGQWFPSLADLGVRLL